MAELEIILALAGGCFVIALVYIRGMYRNGRW